MKHAMLPMLAIACVGLFGLAACSSTKEGETGAAPTGQAPVADVVPLEGKWTCEKDADCIDSCAHGAVNRVWYDKNITLLRECDDGCNDQVSGPPRCIRGECAAFFEDGRLRPSCTRKGTSE